MNAHKLTVSLTVLALVATAASVPFVGCGGTANTNPMPTMRDSGTDTTTNHMDGGGPPSDSSGGDTGSADTSLPDTGSCKSDASTCNSCYTDAQAATDPYNACSTYTKNCVPFTTTVPTHPTL
jgi:hypothetical protein